MANSVSLLNEWASNKVDELDLQYLTPYSHREFLSCIVESRHELVAKILLDETLAISLQCDGSVDRTQNDKLYVMANTVHRNGKTSLYFLGADEPWSKGAV